MPEVFIAGISMTPLGRHVDRSVKDLTRAAVQAALQDAGLADADVQAAWFSNTRQGVMEGQNSIRGQVALHAAGFGGIPVFNTENACASSSSGLAQACAWIESGMADVALVIGVEKMHYEGRREDMLRAFLGALAGYSPRNAIEPRLIDDDGLRGFELIEIELLRHDTDAGLRCFEIGIEIVTEHADGARCFGHERGADADQGAFAGTVGAE